ncbi:FAD-dependent oxidoreductase [Halalkalibacillus sediminis]|uniref:FAD-dependent oxidoreductase n=1 Tax=Halalkalibacillus sediminis TaxID=2018042 RepID=A0A2I0QRB6_9BACI|nr:FAD-dependent oxidoreductase [Halalkalibacillus sediminis]PKR76877.1 FAD-dependent oxidoreductase [Halalkalibacillus sediminis]
MMKYIVIGGGILGASTTYHLAKLGADVTLIDRKDLGQATDAAAGIVCPWLSQRRNKAWYQLVKNGARYYPELVRELEDNGQTETGYKKVGALSLHTDQEKLEKMVERAKKRRDDAPEIGDIELLSNEEAREKFPPLDEKYGAVYVSGGARVDGRAIRDAMIRAAEESGARVVQGSAEILVERNKVTGAKVENEVFETDSVIDTSGAWAKQLLDPLGIQFDVSLQRAQIVHLEMPNQEVNDWPVVMPPNNGYLLSLSNNRIVAGATRTDEAGFDYRVTASGINEALNRALDVAPGLNESTFVETRIGFRPYTPGFLPVIGPVPHFDGLFVANGLGASGLTSGPYLGSVMADLVTGREVKLDISAYDVSLALKR